LFSSTNFGTGSGEVGAGDGRSGWLTLIFPFELMSFMGAKLVLRHKYVLCHLSQYFFQKFFNNFGNKKDDPFRGRLFTMKLWEQGRRLNPLFLIMSQTSYHILYPATKWSECPFKGNLTQEWAHAYYNTSA
jgi:hypothetical protein